MKPLYQLVQEESGSEVPEEYKGWWPDVEESLTQKFKVIRDLHLHLRLPYKLIELLCEHTTHMVHYLASTKERTEDFTRGFIELIEGCKGRYPQLGEDFGFTDNEKVYVMFYSASLMDTMLSGTFNCRLSCLK